MVDGLQVGISGSLQPIIHCYQRGILMTGKIEPVPFLTECRCGSRLFKGSTAVRTLYGWKHCVACRPRAGDKRYEDE